MTGNRRRRVPAALIPILAALAISACQGELVESPRAAHDRRDAADAGRLSRQLGLLAGVGAADVLLHRPFADALAAPVAGSAAAVVRFDPGATDADRVTAEIRVILAGAVPELAPAQVTIVAVPTPPPAALARVGPFEVSPRSRRPLTLALALSLVAIAGLAGWIAVDDRRRRRAGLRRGAGSAPSSPS